MAAQRTKSTLMTFSGCIDPRILLFALFTLTEVITYCEADLDCPRDFFDHGESCYKFNIQPQLTFQEAELACRRRHAVLLSIEDNNENKYVVDWLKNSDIDRNVWLTSGVKRGGKFIWTSDGSTISDFHFKTDEVKNEIRLDEKTDIEYRQIVYRYNETDATYFWEWGRLLEPLSYVCELPKKDLWKLFQQERDFSFGTGILDENEWPVAPNITGQSGDIVFFKKSRTIMTPVNIECYAKGNPHPTYKWFRKTVEGKAVELKGDEEYTITNGRLYIQNPVVDRDVGEYFCEASNKHGTVISNPIRLSYGKLDEFPNVPNAQYTAKLYMGVEIDCQPPTYKPDARFNWFKGSVFKFIRPDLNPQMFLSQNGKLYISEVADSDAGDYYCAIYLAPRAGEKLASGQALSRNSLPITLRVQGDNPNTYGPDIQDKFPQVFPRIPLIGHKLVLECLAYGRLPLQYRWIRTDAPMNPKAYMSDRNRVLIIEKARLQDSGSYMCIVEGFTSTSNKTRQVILSGIPTFSIPLQNKFLDEGSPYSWSCHAEGIPIPTYTWYKDGKQLTATDKEKDITVRGRHLFFKSVTEKHNGVYECEAKNSLGTRRSSAQLIAVAFKPTFARRPVVSSLRASQGGSITIDCLPEAAPRPSITWSKEGGSLPGGYLVHPNGALEMKDLSVGDSGVYICLAENDLGSAESSAKLLVTETTNFLESPESDFVPVNGSTSLRCKASIDKTSGDVMYRWKFYDHVIDFETDVSYSMPYIDKDSGALYLISAQYEHEGQYTCIVSTVTSTVEASAYLTVEGSPEEPGGVHRHKGSIHNGPLSLELWWAPGRVHRHPITNYVIEFNAKGEVEWQDLLSISEEESKINEDQYHTWRGAVVGQGLSPGTSYSFRVRATSGDEDYSKPSLPSGYYKMDDAAPVFAPTNIGGGDGEEQTLRITWDPLPKSKWGTKKGIKYIVYYRRKNRNILLDGKWHSSKEINTTEFNKVIDRDLFYTPYEVKVQAVNHLGSGPNSTITEVMSSELMPTVVPKFNRAKALNSTAGRISWHRVPNTREVVFGSIFAFQVHYWIEDTLCRGINERNSKFTRVYGDVTYVDLIGLDEGKDYCVNIQLLNHAGLGPKTDNYQLRLFHAAPKNYPEYVMVTSHGPESVRVTWRGVGYKFHETPVQGYRAWFWKVGEDIRSAQNVDFGRSVTGVIHGIDTRHLYRLRMMAYSLGGDGKKSPDVMFTLASQVMFNPHTTEVLNSGPTTKHSTILLVLLFLIYYKLF